jgi:periplasmic mercuric ion binding protein
MKKSILSLVMLFFFGTMSVVAETKTEEFKVYGNCGMCKTRIEKAAKSVEGVTKAKWDKVTKMVTITYDESKTDADKVLAAIAKVGHDTDTHKAEDAVYDKLHECCKYDRPKSETSMKGEKDIKKSCCADSKTKSCGDKKK